MSIPRVQPYPVPTHGELPANRVKWRPDPARAMLLVHDMQRYFLDVYADDAPPLADALGNAARLHGECRAQGVPVVFTAQPASQSEGERGLLNDMWGPGLTARPELADIHPTLTPADDDQVLIKWRYSAFQRTNLLGLLAEAGRDQLIICGVYGHIGCLLTAAEAFMNDIQPFLAADAVADFSAADHAMAVSYVANRCGVAASTEALLNDLRRSAAPASMAALRQALAAMLECPGEAIGDHDDLVDLGLDSIRAMTLVERWQAAGLAVELTDLAEDPTPAGWWRVLSGAGTRDEAVNA